MCVCICIAQERGSNYISQGAWIRTNVDDMTNEVKKKEKVNVVNQNMDESNAETKDTQREISEN